MSISRRIATECWATVTTSGKEVEWANKGNSVPRVVGCGVGADNQGPSRASREEAVGVGGLVV
jgi:hypothetical protein